MEQKRKAKADKKLVPKILRKFDKLRRIKSGFYDKAYGIMSAITEALKELVDDFSPTAYFTSLVQMYQQNHLAHDKLGQEALAYCFSAILSMLDIAVIQNQHKFIFEIIATKMLANNVDSQHVAKYGVIALQFLLHSKTEQDWNGSDGETDRAFKMMLEELIDKRGPKPQKQAQKSLCILFQNKAIERLTKPLNSFQQFVTQVFNQQLNQKASSQKTIIVLNFLAAALQLLPLQQCCDIDTKILRILSLEDPYLKTNAYLTLEVLYASRRFTNNSEHVEQILRQLLDNQEVLSVMKTNFEQEQMRVISYLQATTQVMMNYATSGGVKGNDVLKYVSICFSIFCEYLVNTTLRIKNAAFQALRLIVTHCLKKEYFREKSQNQMTDILSLDALTINDQIISMRKGSQTNMSNADKLIIHLRYLLTSRFDEAQDQALKLVKSFIESVGDVVAETPDLLLVVSEIQPKKDTYKSLKHCIGAFMEVMGAQAFFSALPLRLLEIDMHSLTYAHDSRSFLIQVAEEHIKHGDLAFFVKYFLPIILTLDQQVKMQKGQSDLKSKKYETLIYQLWHLLPGFCQYNSPQLSQAFATLINYLEPMINQNAYSLRPLALKAFHTLIQHCRNTKEVTHEIKQTRSGLQRICMDYIEGLSTLYKTLAENDPDRQIVLDSIQDFASIAKSVKLSNLFLQTFATVLQTFETQQQGGPFITRQLEILLSMMEKIKLKKENYMALMKGIKSFLGNQQTQKHGYKILARVIEKYELQDVKELRSIQEELNLLLQGHASKQRLMLLRAYVTQMEKFKGDQSNLQVVGDLLKLMIVELITAYSSTNKKIKKMSEEVFKIVYNLMRELKALPHLFQMLLVGLGGSKVQTQSATIRSMLLLLKINYLTKEEGVIDVNESSFQDFLRKVTKIITIFLKDHSSGNELHRSVLKFIKTVVSFLSPEQLKGELSQSMMNGTFGLQSSKKSSKHTALIKKILGKFIRKLGLDYVKSVVPSDHQKLITYIERDRRKRLNKKRKLNLLALLGKEEKEKEKKIVGMDGLSSSEESDDELEVDESEMRNEDDEKQSNDSDASDESEDDDNERVRGGDLMMTDSMDIPRVDDIPVVSKLAGKKEVQKKLPKAEQVTGNRDKMKKIMEAEEDDFESHFVENPFIKMREKALAKNIDAQKLVGEGVLNAESKEHDIVVVKETGKFIIKDLEGEERKLQEKKNLKKRTRTEAMVDEGASEDSESANEEDNIAPSQKRLKTSLGGFKNSKKATDSNLKKKRGRADDDGHITKYSGSAYQSSKGHGDVLKKGKYEPFAYIQLNPKMLNKRNKQKAVQSFEGVISHGKKIGKRSGSKQEGLLSGMAFKKD